MAYNVYYIIYRYIEDGYLILIEDYTPSYYHIGSFYLNIELMANLNPPYMSMSSTVS